MKEGCRVADELKTCANCGHAQASGAFCEACGTKLPDAPAVAAAAAAAPPPPPPPAPAAQPAAPVTPPPTGRYADLGTKGFWSRFFDLSFSDYITPSVIKILFIVIMVVIGLSVIGGIIAGFTISAGTGVFALIGGLIYGFLALLFSRVFLEVVIVFFHIHDNTKAIAKSKQ
jgi:Domain of unknown function (DUF4282)